MPVPPAAADAAAQLPAPPWDSVQRVTQDQSCPRDGSAGAGSGWRLEASGARVTPWESDHRLAPLAEGGNWARWMPQGTIKFRVCGAHIFGRTLLLSTHFASWHTLYSTSERPACSRELLAGAAGWSAGGWRTHPGPLVTITLRPTSQSECSELRRELPLLVSLFELPLCVCLHWGA